MSSLPKLLYFNGAGRVFALRVAMFKAFGTDGWVDERIDFADWAPTIGLTCRRASWTRIPS